MSSVGSLPAATPLASLHMHRASDHVVAHPVTCVETVHMNRGTLVVAAGGSHISAGFDWEWFPPQTDATNSGGSGLFPCASSSADGGAQAAAAAGRGVGASGEKGMLHVHEAVETLLWQRASHDDGIATRVPAPLTLSSGQVSCMAVRVLPGGGGALGVVGTTVGSLCVFVADGSTLAILREYTMEEWSEGMITVQDVVRSVGIGLDPAGRLEFLAVSTAHCAVVVDIQSLDDDRTQAQGTQAIAVLEQSRQKQRLSTLKRARSTTCVVPFVHTEVVRVLVPERHNAAFGFDLAVVLVLADATLRFVERTVRGGSVRLLQDHHTRLQQASSAAAYALDRTTGDEDLIWQQEAGLLTDARALPHVVYEYTLATFQFNVSQAADAARFHESGVCVNDAALSYNSRTGRMDVVLVGAMQSAYTRTTGAAKSGTAAAHASAPVLSALARRAMAAGLLSPTSPATTATIGDAAPHSSALATARGADGAQQRLGWWAVARGVVLPQHTTRSVLVKEHWYASAVPDTQTPETLAATAADGEDAYVSAHTIHVQSSTVRLRRPRAPTSAYPTAASMMPSAPAAAPRGGRASHEGSSSPSAIASVDPSAAAVSPLEAAPAHGPTGAGATVDSYRSELSAIAIVRDNDLALIASGTELYVASLSDAPIASTRVGMTASVAAASTSLSALRHVRSGGTLREELACLSTVPLSAAASGAKNAILSAGGSSVVLLTV